MPIPGFFIIASKKNRISINEFEDKEADEFFKLARKLRKGMEDILGIKKVRFFQDETTHHKLFYLWLLPKHQWMEKFGEKIGSIQPIIDYAKENMINDQVFAEVKDMVAKMKEYMKSFKL